MMQQIDLFSGIGGFSVAGHEMGWPTVAFCEIMPFPRAVLAKNFPNVPIHGDIRTLTKEILISYGWNPNKPTILTGGFPCQPFSVAGKRKGADDDRYLWPQMLRVAKEAQPAWIVGENVGGFASMELDTGIAEMADQEGAFILFKKVAQQVIDDLNSIGYDVPRTDEGYPILFVIPACAINAPHRRDRVWIIAHRNDHGQHATEVRQRLPSRNDGDATRTNQTEQPSGCAVSGGASTTNTNPNNSQAGSELNEQLRETAISKTGSSQNANSTTNGEFQECGSVGQFGNAGAGSHERDTGAANGGNATDTSGVCLQGCNDGQGKEQSWGSDSRNATDTMRIGGRQVHANVQSNEPDGQGLNSNSQPQFTYWRNFPTEPPLHVGDDGLRAELVQLGCSNPDRVIQFQRENAIKGAGNAIVPWVALEIFKAIEYVESNR